MREHLARTGADPARITVELTETAMHADAGDPEPVLRALHDLGLQLALDDFGSGYSSLSRLREMPMDTLKIDRAFLRQVPENREAAAIITAILALARALGRATVAEGVETEAQRAFLIEQQCPFLQGFLLARPMPVDEVEALMSASPPRPETAVPGRERRVLVRNRGPRAGEARADGPGRSALRVEPLPRATPTAGPDAR